MHRFVGLFIGLLVLIDAFFIAYAVGINVRKTTVVDPSLPIKSKAAPTAPVAPAAPVTPAPTQSSNSEESGPVSSDSSKDAGKDASSDR